MTTTEGAGVRDSMDDLIARFSLHNPETQANRYELFEHMRESCPVAKSDAHGGFHAVSRYNDVYDIAHATDVFSSFPVTIPEFGNPVPMVPIEQDPPAHRTYRTLLSGRFTMTAIEKMESDFRAIVTDIIDKIADAEEVDLVPTVAVPLPLRVIMESFLGVPEEDWGFLYDQAVIMLQPDPGDSDAEKAEKAMGAGLEVMIYFATRLNHMRETGEYGEDLLSVLDQAELDGERLNDDEILGFVLLLLPAGFDTTAGAIGPILMTLAERPEIREYLSEATPEQYDLAVEELVRYFSPVTGLARTATQECTFADHKFEEGDRVLLLFASANRDESEFPNADEIVLDRQPNRHLAFGSGIHRCLGAHVARSEIRILLQEFLRRMPTYTVDRENVKWHTGDTWGLKSLPVRFER